MFLTTLGVKNTIKKKKKKAPFINSYSPLKIIFCPAILNPATFCQTRHLKLISENIMKQKMFVTSIIYNQNYYFDFFPRLKSILTSQKKIAFFVLSFKNSITFSL